MEKWKKLNQIDEKLEKTHWDSLKNAPKFFINSI